MGRAFEIYNRFTGETLESGYTRREAKNSIAWCWNTGGEIGHLAVRRDPSIPIPEWQAKAGKRLGSCGGRHKQ